MKRQLNSKTLADAHREIQASGMRMPYKTVMGRRFTDEHDTQMEICYYTFETKEDYEEWKKGDYFYEKQLTGPQVLRDVNHHPEVRRWFREETKEQIMTRIKTMYGCSNETARWVYKNLKSVYDTRTIRINE